jgi:signal transduction histidine kinase
VRHGVRRAREEGFALDDLRVQGVPLVAGAAAAAAVGLLVQATLQTEPVAPELIATAAALGAIAGGGHALRGRPAVAAGLLVVGLGAVVVGAGAFWVGPAAAPWLAPVVVAAAALRGWRAGAATAALATGALLLALAWAWTSYERAERLMEEARARQAELARLSKSLNETCYQLELANHELERARRAAETAQRVKAEFATAISHELRTPLNLIIGFSEMMVIAPHTYEGETLPEAYRGDVQAIYRAACHLSGLVDDVLDLAEVEAHRMALEKEWVELAVVVDEAVATVVTLVKDRGLSLTTEVPPDLPPLYADRTQVRQVLINLLTNAARFTSIGGATVRARVDDRDVEIAVADSGAGIPPEEVPSLFRLWGPKGRSRAHAARS